MTTNDLNNPFRNHTLYRFPHGPIRTVSWLKSLETDVLKSRVRKLILRVNDARVLKLRCSFSRKWYEVIPEESHGGSIRNFSLENRSPIETHNIINVHKNVTLTHKVSQLCYRQTRYRHIKYRMYQIRVLLFCEWCLKWCFVMVTYWKTY